MSLRKLFRQYTSFTRGEQRGVLILCGMLLLLAVLRWTAPREKTAAPTFTDEETRLIEAFLQEAGQISGTPFERRSSPQEAKRPVPVTDNRFSASSVRYPPAVIDLNEADSADFESLRGIGPVLAARIVRYRNLLGGFASAAQLKEVYGLRSGLADTLSVHFRTDTGRIRKIDLNTAGERVMRTHPYLGSAKARAILALRNHSDSLVRPSDLTRHNILTPAELDRILPYLTR